MLQYTEVNKINGGKTLHELPDTHSQTSITTHHKNISSVVAREKMKINNTNYLNMA